MIDRKANYLDFFNSTLTLQSKKASLFARIVLLVLMVLSFLLPLVVMTLLSLFELELNFGHFYWFIIFCLIGFYFLRLYLWNSYGKEIIEFEKERIIYFADYKLFKDSRKSINGINAKFEIKEIDSNTGKMGLLIISNESEVIETVTKVKLQELADFLKKNNLPITPCKFYLASGTV